MDHAGSAKALQELTGAKVAASPQDAEYISGQKTFPKPKNLLMRAANSIIKTAPAPVEVILKDGDVICGLIVIETPGHTPGSIMLLDKNRKVLFAGDTLRLGEGKVTGGPGHFTWDATKEKESVHKIAQRDFDVLLPGHADYLVGEASVKVREYAKSIGV